MAARSIASLSLSFGLVSIPVKLYSATESSATVRFNMLDKDGARLKQQYVSEKDQHSSSAPRWSRATSSRSRFVSSSPKLKALQENPATRSTSSPSSPTRRSIRSSTTRPTTSRPTARRPALEPADSGDARKRPGRARQVGVEGQAVRRPGAAAEDGLVPQQLLYADEARSMKELDIEKVTVTPAELKLAMQLIEQISEDTYDPTMFEDEEKAHPRRDRREDHRQADLANEPHEPASGGAQFIDLVEALRASLGKGGLKGEEERRGKAEGEAGRESGGASRSRKQRQGAPGRRTRGEGREGCGPPRARGPGSRRPRADPNACPIHAPSRRCSGLSRIIRAPA